MSRSNYLNRRQARLALQELKLRILFGLVISSLLLLTGLWRYWFLVGASSGIAAAQIGAGLLGLALTLVFPSAWGGLESLLGRALRLIGGGLFALLLSAIYFLFITPAGWLVRRLKGRDPIYSWTSQPPEGMEGWHPKQVLFETHLGASGGSSSARRFINVIQFFIARGHYFFLPTLILLMALGLVLFFVKSSALAPFIYALF